MGCLKGAIKRVGVDATEEGGRYEYFENGRKVAESKSGRESEYCVSDGKKSNKVREGVT